MHRITRILVPTDLTELSHGAAEYARMVAHAFDAIVYVIHAVEPVVANDPLSPPVLTQGNPITAQDRVLADEFARRHFGEGHQPAEVRTGTPARVIVEYAAEVRADLIVIGTHADGTLRRVLHGSVSKSVLETAPCPVLMVPLAVLQASQPGAAPAA